MITTFMERTTTTFDDDNDNGITDTSLRTWQGVKVQGAKDGKYVVPWATRAAVFDDNSDNDFR